jgi:hypothetical protein
MTSSSGSQSLKNKITDSIQRDTKRKKVVKDSQGLSNAPKYTSTRPTKAALIKSSSDLPIAALRADLINSVKTFPTTIIVGETGSGKSTQLAQYLADEFHSKGQPFSLSLFIFPSIFLSLFVCVCVFVSLSLSLSLSLFLSLSLSLSDLVKVTSLHSILPVSFIRKVRV